MLTNNPLQGAGRSAAAPARRRRGRRLLTASAIAGALALVPVLSQQGDGDSPASTASAASGTYPCGASYNYLQGGGATRYINPVYRNCSTVPERRQLIVYPRWGGPTSYQPCVTIAAGQTYGMGLFNEYYYSMGGIVPC